MALLVRWLTRPLGRQRYKLIVKYKTSFYSFFLPVAAGLLLAGSSQLRPGQMVVKSLQAGVAKKWRWGGALSVALVFRDLAFPKFLSFPRSFTWRWGSLV
jgi:hypothetical protein